MNVKVSFNIEIDETLFKNLKKSEIRNIVKDATESNGSVINYIEDEAISALQHEDYNKM